MELAALYRDIVEKSPDGLWVFDLDGRTLFANPEMARMLGVSDAEMADLTVFDPLDATGREQLRIHLEGVRRGELEAEPVEVQLVARDGTIRWTLVRESGMRDEDGTLTAVLHRFTAYDARRAMIAELRSSREQLSEAQRIARIGHWTWDLDRDEITGSASLFDLYGLNPESFPAPYAAFADIVHPDDRDTVDTAVREALAGQDEFVFEARVRGADDWVWTRGRGVVHRDAQGVAVSMSGTHQDISHSKETELALVDSVTQNALMQAVASAANEARSLREVLAHARDLVLLHDDWERGRAFLPDEDGRLRPLYVTDEDREDDAARPELTCVERELAERSFAEGRPLWDDTRLTIAFPVVHDGTSYCAITITSAPPLYRHQMIEQMVGLVAIQLGRVVERELAERQLATARDAAEEASRQKSEFLATMSHEIRTPLNGVIGLNELLLRTRLDDDQHRLASGVQLASKALLSVINDVLDFSKIEAGRLDLEELEFELEPVFHQLESILGEAARARGNELRLRILDLPSTVTGDPTRLLQVLTNLVSNAVKFTESGTVTVEARSETLADGRTRVAVTVADTGVGVSADAVDGLFSPFRQADASTTRVYGGTGLGLAISKEIVDALGGEIDYRPNPGGGSVFSFTAVFRAADADAPSRPDADRMSGEDAGDSEGSAGSEGSEDEPTLDTAGSRRFRVLVVEDNEINQMVAVGVLESLDFEVDVAGDGVEAVAATEHTTYDVVLMDVQMPRMDGYAATRAIRERDASEPRVPIVAMTAAAIDGERERCLAAGMDHFLTKPVDPKALSAVLTEVLTRMDPSEESSPPPDPGGPATAELDVERLDALRDLDENAAYLDRAIGNFTVKSADLVDDMRAAADRGDVDELRYASHRLVGSAFNLGLASVGAASRAVEALADTGTVAGASALIEELEQQLGAAVPALLAYRSSYGVAS